MKVSVADAKNKLPKLIKAAEEGENITICRRGVPVADLVPTKASRGEKPMSQEEVEEFVEGRS